MDNDLSLPPNRPRPKGSNKRKGPKAENRPRRAAAPATAGSGISTGYVLAALGAGLLLAYLSTTEASGGTNSTDTGELPTPTGPGTSPAPEPIIRTGSVPATKPARRPIAAPSRPLVFVYVDSFGGEGIFDRLKTADSLLDGHGLDRITTLANGEFAGIYTGKYWAGAKRANGTTPTYLQLYLLIDRRPYNYWIDAEQVKQFHAPGATQHEGWGTGYPISATTKQLITSWYADHYA